jgi:hypothetical protein
MQAVLVNLSAFYHQILIADTNLFAATSKAMMDAVLRLLQEGAACCRFHRIITGDRSQVDDEPTVGDTISNENRVHVSDHLNASQILAVESCRVPLSLIWGPPGRLYTTLLQLLC